MSRREIRCGSKRGYTSRSLARDAIRRFHQFARMSTYRCEFCGLWHVGHTKLKARRKVSA